jgi:nucleotide-binding universal stress UspA family protein
MKKILCPIDFSELSTHAAEYAAELAQATGAELIFMHALHVPIPDANTPIDLSAEIMNEQKEALAKRMDEFCDNIAKKYYVKVDQRIEYGLAATMISRVAKEEGVYLIAMGTKGADNILDKLFGSITSEVINKAPCAVIAIPESARFRKFKKVMYATDLTNDDNDELEEFAAVTSIFKPKIDVVHVEKDASIDISEDDPLLKKVLHEHDNIRHVEVRNINVEDALFKYADYENVDLIALKKHKFGVVERLFHKSLTRSMSLHSSIPLFIFKEKDD